MIEGLHLKLILIGDSGVGKTTFASRITNSECSASHVPTIGSGYFSYTFMNNDVPINVDIWDTAGQEMYRSLVPQYARNSHCVIIVFDLTNEQTFLHIDNWLRFIEDQISDVKILLFGNKNDLQDKRQVDSQRASQYALSKNTFYAEGSAIEGTDIEASVQSICVEKYEELKDHLTLEESRPIPAEKDEKPCC